MLVKLDHFPRDRDEHKKNFELPPPSFSFSISGGFQGKTFWFSISRVTSAIEIDHDVVNRCPTTFPQRGHGGLHDEKWMELRIRKKHGSYGGSQAGPIWKMDEFQAATGS